VSTNLSSLSSATLTSGSGIDVDTIVSNLVAAARAPETVWQNQQLKLQSQQAALNEVQSNLGSLETSVNSLKDFAGVFESLSSASSDNSIATATAGAGATAGQHSIEVDHLATQASYYSNTMASGSTTLADGTLSIKVGSADAVAITIDSTNNTLDTLAAQINKQRVGVNASVVTDAKGARLVIAGSNTGVANDVTLTATGPLSFTQSSFAANAKLVVDGIPIESATNNVSGALSGVTLELQSAAPDKPVTLTVSQDISRVSQAINDFVSSFNSIIGSINTQFTYDAATQTSGALSGDASIRTLQQQLLEQVSYSNTACGDIGTLSSLGITMNDDGTLAVDRTKLNSALQSDFSNVKKFFQGDGTTGFAISFGNTLGDLTDSTSGPLVVDLKGNTDQQKTLTDQINDFELQITNKRQQWLDQFSQVDAMLRQFPLTQLQVTSELNSLNNLK
jgi:flagellar hook-associated protein 2